MLSKQQLEIVNSNAKNIIVDAGSGSGKTRTLVERVRRLLHDGVDPNSVVVITFTNLAADELISRLSDIPNYEKCFVGTIHSYAHKLLRKSGYDFDIFSEEYQTKYMKYLIDNGYAHRCTMDDYLKYLRLYKKATSGTISKSEIPNSFSNYSAYEELLILLGIVNNQSYKTTVKTLCKANNVITFDELLKLSTEYFNSTKTVLKYLFVDELQDIGCLEYNFLRGLNAENSFVIGDDYQELYQFKGGDVQIFLSLMENPEWEHFFLTENYRTAKNILRYANTVIRQAPNIIVKETIPMNENAGELKFYSKSQLDDVLKGVNENDDWLILTRSNRECGIVEAKLKELGKKFYCYKPSQVSDEQMVEIKSKPCIKVMTTHASKGGEAENVLVYGKFPANGRTSNPDEFKVYYVAITRAKNRCWICV